MVKANKKYLYDYPEYREIGKELTAADFRMIAERTGKTEMMVRRVLHWGDRRNAEIVKYGRMLAEINRQKKAMINQ